MKFGFRIALVLAGAMLAGSHGVAGAAGQEEQSFTRSLTVAQTAIYDAGPPPGRTDAGDDALQVVAWVDRADYTYAIGESVRIYVKTNKDAYVTVLNTDPAGESTRLFPNRHQSDNFVRANQTLEVPGPGSRSRIMVTGTVGDELLKVVASTSPVSLFEGQQLSDSGPFQVVRTQARRTARSLSVVMGAQQPAGGGGSTVSTPAVTPVSTGGGSNMWAVCHQKIRTTAATTLASRTRSLQVRTNDSGGSVRCEE